MSEGKTILTPPWKELVKIAEGWEYGSFYTDEEIAEAIGVNDLQSNKRRFFGIISTANKILIPKSRWLKRKGIVPGLKKDGYEVVRPDDYPVLILKKIRTGTRHIKKALDIAEHAPVNKMSEETKKTFMGTMEAVKNGVEQIKKVESVSITALLILKPKIQLSEARPIINKSVNRVNNTPEDVKTDVKTEPPEDPPLEEVEFPDEEHGGDGSVWMGDLVLILEGEMKGKKGKVLSFPDSDNIGVLAEILFDDGEKKNINIDYLSFIERPPEDTGQVEADNKPTHKPEEEKTPPTIPEDLPLAIGDTVVLLHKPNAKKIEKNTKKIGKIKNIVDGSICVEIESGEIVWPPHGTYRRSSIYDNTNDISSLPSPTTLPVKPPVVKKQVLMKEPKNKPDPIPTHEFRFCTECKQEKPEDAFGLYNAGGKTRRGRCKECDKKIAEQRRKQSTEPPAHMKGLKPKDYVKQISGNIIFSGTGQVQSIKPTSVGWEALVRFNNGAEWIDLRNLEIVNGGKP